MAVELTQTYHTGTCSCSRASLPFWWVLCTEAYRVKLWLRSTPNRVANTGEQVDAYPLYAASALAANAFVRCLFAGRSSPAARDAISHGCPRRTQQRHCFASITVSRADADIYSQRRFLCLGTRCIRSWATSGHRLCWHFSPWPCFPSRTSSSGTASRFDARAASPRARRSMTIWGDWADVVRQLLEPRPKMKHCLSCRVRGPRRVSSIA